MTNLQLHGQVIHAELTSRPDIAPKFASKPHDAFNLVSWYSRYVADVDDSDEERPHKRVKLDRNDKTTAVSNIAFAQAVIVLSVEEFASIPDQTPVTFSVAKAKATSPARPVRIGHVKHEAASGLLTICLQCASVSTTSPAVIVTARHNHTGKAVEALQLARKLQQRTKPGPASATITLNSDQDACGRISSLTLTVTLNWLDGHTSPFVAPGKQNPDLEVLYTLLDVPHLEHGSRWVAAACAPQDFYDAVDRIPTGPVTAHKSGLNTHLYPFQHKAVEWMLQREGNSVRGSSVLSTQALNDPSHLLRQAQALDGTTYFIDDLQRRLVTARNLVSHAIRGGILAEEMGLGKTVEILSLICLNKLNPKRFQQDPHLAATKATLIVTPNAILQQWKDEASRHAPHLKWTHYKGMSHLTKANMTEEDAVKTFQDADIVFTTYPVLAQEIHFAVDPPDRKLRNTTSQRPRKRSPLIQLSWWRLCMDEAQMLETSVSQAATTATVIPRVNTWAVSGTPVRRDVRDLQGLLIFLRHEPYLSSAAIWRRLIQGYDQHFREHFKALFGPITLRHTKDKIKDQLKLPPQRRVVVTVPFTAIEEQNYRSLFEEMARVCGLAVDGSPLSGLWDPNDGRTIENMRSWLARLRQTCLHPQVGARNKRALGKSSAPLRTVTEVLRVMIEQAEAVIRNESRIMVTALNGRGHVLANAKSDEQRAVTALPIYLAALKEVEPIVKDARAELKSAEESDNDDEDGESQNHDAAEDSEARSAAHERLNGLRFSLRSALELHHACEFFVGTAYYQAKIQKVLKETDDEWQLLEKSEGRHYDNAKALRRECMLTVTQKAEKTMAAIRANQGPRNDHWLPSLDMHSFFGGIESQKLVDRAERLSLIFGEQAELLDEWRDKLTELLLGQLLDKDDDEVTGEEYEESTKQQENISIYWDIYRALVADRSTAITGLVNPLVNQEISFTIQQSLTQDEEDRWKEREPPESRSRMRHLLGVRNELMKRAEGLSLRGIVHEARALEIDLSWDGIPQSQEEREHQGRAKLEAQILRRLAAQLSMMIEPYTKVQKRLDKNLELFRTAMNHRFEFYRQLQQLSDRVRPYKEELDETLDQSDLDMFIRTYNQSEATVATTRAKHRFLLHLQTESDGQAERLCVICQSTFENGVLTVCGHQFCKDCIGHWWQQHRTCPVCKRMLRTVDFHNITYKPRKLEANEETYSSSTSVNGTSTDEASETGPHGGDGSPKIYSNISAADLTLIQSIDLPNSRSFGTKIDTIARHLLHIRSSDPGCKTIVFSQYRDFLDVLSSALTIFGISHVAITRPDSITRFREDPSIEAFLLDAKTDASGLNLVNATNVMLAEPLVNPSVELQAIARVHRIGQTRETRVFMYLVKDTVEESVYEVSARRRLELMKRLPHEQTTGPAAASGLDVDSAERLEVQAGGLDRLVAKDKRGGENVRAEDLWQCLFGVASRQQHVGIRLQDDGAATAVEVS